MLLLPAGATRFTGTPPAGLAGPALGAPATPYLIDTTVYWRVPGESNAVDSWVEEHTPPGFSRAGSSTGTDSDGVSLSAPIDPAAPQNQPGSLEVSAAPFPGSAGVSIWRIDGMDIWYDPTPTPDTKTGPRLHVTVTGGCPGSFGDAVDVSNTSTGLDDALLPLGHPTAALICQFPDTNPPPLGRPASSRLLTGAAAIALANQARGLRTGSQAAGEFSCPMDDNRVSVIAFAFASGDVDLWWHESGCGSVDNGHIVAFQGSLTLPKA